MTKPMIGMQTAQGTRATTPPATTSQNPRATTDQDLQKAAQDLRDAVRNNVNQELLKANAQEAARAALAQQPATPTTPTPPAFPFPGDITIQRPDGRNTIIHVPPGGFANTIPPQARDISIAFFIMIAAIIIGLPIARAFARRMDRRGGVAQIPTEISSQLAHLNQAVDAIALEVERISEGQRFTARLLSEQREPASQTLPSGANR
jgi:hypothetical protein